MLHLFAQPVLDSASVERIAAGDDVLLQHGSLWAAFQGHAANSKVRALLAKPSRIYVLQAMLEVNGIAAEQLLEGVVCIDYAGLVALTEKNPVIHTWC